MKPTLLRTVLFMLVLTGCTTQVTGWYGQPDSGDTDGNSDVDSDSDSDADTGSETGTDTDSETETETEDTETEDTSTGDTETEWPTDTETDTEAATDTGDDTGSDTGTDLVGDCSGPGVYFDTSEGVCWELNPPATAVTYTAADTRCASLVLDGASDWRVPNINELQMLVEGCATPGCGVHDPSCLYDWCDDSCPVCSMYGGAAPGGCYWEVSLGGSCSGAGYWSSSLQAGVAYTSRWCVNFSTGGYMFEGGAVAYARCIRNP